MVAIGRLPRRRGFRLDFSSLRLDFPLETKQPRYLLQVFPKTAEESGENG